MTMKIALIQPNLDEKLQKSQRQAYSSPNRPPETGLAVLASWISTYSKKPHEVSILDPNKKIEELVEEASKCGIFGLSDWFSNHESCLRLAKSVKQKSPGTKIVFGGPNASMMPDLLLENHPYIDYVIQRDGEDTLLGLAEGLPLNDIPNLWYWDGKNIRFTYTSFTDLGRMLLWDFSCHQNVDSRLHEYLDAQRKRLDPWLVPPVTLFSFRGCMKAVREGVCSYCTSSETQGRALPPEKLWGQIINLNNLYGAEIFYMCDDIFPVSPARVKQIAEAKPPNVRARIRAYAYLPDLASLPQSELEEMAVNLKRIGIFNLFFGSETYDKKVLHSANKKGISVEETARIMKTLRDVGGIGTTMAYLLGLPKESKESLEANLESLRRLLKVGDCLERLYISVGMPLIGTPWYHQLVHIPEVVEEYKKQTGKQLAKDDSPDYDLLSRLSIRHMSYTTPHEVNACLAKMVDAAREKMPDYRIGGFMLEVRD